MDMAGIRKKYNLKKSGMSEETGHRLRYAVPGRIAIPSTFAFFIVLLIIVTIVAYKNMWSIESAFRDSVEVHSKHLRLLDELLQVIQQRQLTVNDVILNSEVFEKSHDKSIIQFQKTYDQVTDITLSPRDRKQIYEIKRIFESSIIFQDQAIEYALSGTVEKAVMILNRGARPKVKQVYSRLLDLRNRQYLLSQNTYAKARDNMASDQQVMLYVSGAAITLGGLLAFNVLGRVRKAFNGYYHSQNKLYAELEDANYALRMENRERKRVEEQIRQHRDDLETRVHERTQELESEILIRTNAEQQLRISKERSENAGRDLQQKNAEIEVSMGKLKVSQQKVAEKSVAMHNTNLKVMKEINVRKLAEEKLKKTQKEMLEMAHRAGMSEIISGVLHNVGNILNTVKTSAEMIQQIVSKLKLSGLNKANEMLRDHWDHLGTFISEDPKGKRLPDYYLKLGGIYDEETERLQHHMSELKQYIMMMGDVISAQQNYAKSGIISEFVQLSLVLEETLQMQLSAISRHHIIITKRYQPVPEVYIQKVKLVEVLMNLIKNSKEAMLSLTIEKKLLLEIIQDGNFVLLRISDNGSGIEQSKINKIFSHGFTTKESGHGFGLHASANAMTEMGGRLIAKSEGTGKGATFIVVCPVAKPEDKHKEINT